ncbi:hypothetical protein M0R88_10605 [Halorussus gelatinilyticus]|uniref:CHAT domain-containing protein n=1 Tax=Halorussus gelatinilyticus TaxID=2937524 RepID=A0A8U0IFZ6_9EURY|nr:hypothetical protein [Halorussus gelatinilyticus]UPV98978.1 hypothetical protein M0R88_10605 [Halorussus gelatinilyticus]
MEPRITTSTDRPGITIFDPIEQAQFALYTPTAVDPMTADVDIFPAPVSTAVRINTTGIDVPSLSNIYVRSPTGDLITETSGQTDQSLPRNEYVLELTTAPVKLYLRVESALDIKYREATVRIGFGPHPVAVYVGTRSFHEHPAGTITVPDDPRDVMKAVSLFGSALKDLSPERSFPTLRGHPPLIERGNSFDAPTDIERPETGVSIELPPEYEYVYPATSLAYYLGADVRPANTPRLVTENGFEHVLDGPLGYEENVRRTLQQVFFLDCLTRTEGLYDVDLHERTQVEPLVSLDFEALYDQSLAAQLEAYLSVPISILEPHLPQWSVTMDIVPNPEHVSMLPFAATQLAVIRSPTPDTQEPAPTPDMITEFTRGGESVNKTEVLTRSAHQLQDIAEDEIFTPESTESIRHTWVGEGYPLGANKATTEAYERQLDQGGPEQSSITIHVVCNDEQMESEGVVEEFYGVRELLEFDVTVHYRLDTEELQELLTASADLFHFIGHVDSKGLRCPDGHLDARLLDEVQVKAFVLNACRSYAQGQALVESGSLGGVVTLSEITNNTGTRVGCALAKALNRGFPLQVAVDLVQRVVGGYSYMTIGDGGLTLVQSESGCCYLSELEQAEDGWFVDFTTIPMRTFNMGTLFDPVLGDQSTQYLASGLLNTFSVTDEELENHFAIESHPVIFNDELFWTNEVTVTDLRE